VYAGKPAATVSICQCLMKRRSCHVDRTAVVSSTAAATLRQLVMFIVDKIVEEDCCVLLANELKSITPPDRTTQVLDPGAARDVVVIFEDLCLLGNGASAIPATRVPAQDVCSWAD
jgi:hypothetical protein